MEIHQAYQAGEDIAQNVTVIGYLPVRRLYFMMCAQCGYAYRYDGEEYEWEHCPICAHCAPFSEFVKSTQSEEG
jgi:rubrerythrin